MARKSGVCTRNHAYGLETQHCATCGAHVASRCPECGYMSLYDEDHRPGCEAVLLADEAVELSEGRAHPAR